MSAQFKKQRKTEQAPAPRASPDVTRQRRNRWFAAAISLALLGCWGLFGWVTGLPLGGEIRADPFNVDADSSSASKFVDAFISTIPHPTLAKMSAVPTGLAGALSPRPVPAEFVNAPQSAMNKIRAPKTEPEIQMPKVGPSQAANDGARPASLLAGVSGPFLVAEQPSSSNAGKEAPQKQAPLEKEAPQLQAPKAAPSPNALPAQLGISPPAQQAPSQEVPSQVPLKIETPVQQPSIEQKVPPKQQIAPQQALPRQRTIESDKAALLAAVRLKSKDGQSHLVAIDMAGNPFGLDEKAGWRPTGPANDFLGLTDSIAIKSLRSPDVKSVMSDFAVGYMLNTTNSSWLIFRALGDEQSRLFPIVSERADSSLRVPVWNGERFGLVATEPVAAYGIYITQETFPNFGLAHFLRPDVRGLPRFYSATFAPGVGGAWSVWAGSDKGLLEMRAPVTDSADLVLHNVPTTALIRSIFFHSATRGWASSGWEGDHRPVVFETRNGGQTWHVIPYRWLPAPWVCLAFLLTLGASSRAIAEHEEYSRLSEKAGIAEHGVSDNPIGLDDPDALGLTPIARAMSRFLRNVQTTPSLAIGVAGPWGSGKSSLMNLVRQDLEDRGIRPVWFNAWHHQKEDSLLAALLTIIRSEAVLPAWSWSGWRVRFFSFWNCMMANPVRTGAMLAAIFLLIAVLWWLLATFGPRLVAGVQILITTLIKGDQTPSGLIGGVAVSSSAQMDLLTALLGGLGISATTIAVGRSFWQLIKPFSTTPVKLLASLRSRSSNKDLEQQLAFRYRFAREFSAFCTVLRHPPNPGLVIFVDDLDRCGARETVEMLEALNFVTTAGNCFVILGYDEEKVEASIADVYKASVLQLRRDDTSPNLEPPRKQDLVWFAQSYLQKLVHIVVPVPQARKDNVEQLLGLKPSSSPSLTERRARRWRNLVAEAAIPVLLLLGILALGGSYAWPHLPSRTALHVFMTGAELPQLATSAGTRPVEPSSPTIAGAAETQGGKTSTATQPTKLAEVRNPNWIESLPRSVIIVLIVILLLVPAVWMLRRYYALERLVDDSPDFRKALEIWGPVVALRRETPRGIKRFMNWVRFLAMRVRDIEQEQRARGKTSPLDEPLLVDFAATDETSDDGPWPPGDNAAAEAELRKMRDSARQKFADIFPESFEASKHAREIYVRIAGLIEERSPRRLGQRRSPKPHPQGVRR